MFYQLATIFHILLIVVFAQGTPPPGYKPKPQEPDPNPPKYEYGYKIADGKGETQGKVETRDGIYALGRYYVQGSTSSQKVDYLADDWGYHPYVQYSNVSPHSRASAQIVLGKEAVAAYRNNQNGDPTSLPNAINPSSSGNEVVSSVDDPPKAKLSSSNLEGPPVPTDGNTSRSINKNSPLIQHSVNLPSSISSQQVQITPKDYQGISPVLQTAPVIENNSPDQVQIQIIPLNTNNNAQSFAYPADLKLSKPILLENSNAQYVFPQNGLVQNKGQQELFTDLIQPIILMQPQSLDASLVLLDQNGDIIQNQNVLQQYTNFQNVITSKDTATNFQHNIIENGQSPLALPLVHPHVVYEQQTNGDQKVINEQFDIGEKLSLIGQQAAAVQEAATRQKFTLSEHSINEHQSITEHNRISEERPFTNNRPAIEHQSIEDAHSQIHQHFTNQQKSTNQDITTVTINSLKMDQEETKQTAPLYESGAEVSSEDLKADNMHLAGSYGAKIQQSIINHDFKNVKPSKLIESTKNLITELDVLNINDAVTFELTTPTSGGLEQNSVTVTKENSESSFHISSTTLSTLVDQAKSVTPLNLLHNPIVVADYNSTPTLENTKHHEEIHHSHSEQIEDTKSQEITNEEVIVTPRPDIMFLAPITAGVQLQNVERPPAKKKIVVEIQKSVPYYVGKYEYVQNSNDDVKSPDGVIENIKLGESLIDFPVKEEISAVFKTSVHEESNEEHKAILTNTLDQQEEQGTNVSREETNELPHQFIYGNKENAYVTKYIDRPYPVHVPYPIEKVVEKYINRPYPVHIPFHIPIEVPVTVEKKIPVPYPVEKIVEKPVEKIVEKEVHIPQPYPVEKIIEKKVPVEVTKYIDRPYPVQVPVPQPYPVEKVVEKVVNKPYPVPVQIPYQVPVHVPVQVPIQVPVVIAHQSAVNSNKLNAQLSQQLPVAQAYYLPNDEHNKQQSNNIRLDKIKQYYYNNPYVYVNSYQTVQKNQHQSTQNQHQSAQENRVHVSYANNPHSQSHYVIPQQNYQVQQHYISWEVPQSPNCKPVEQNQYIGLVPPRNPNLTTSKKRQARKQSFESPRLEYGFLPPLVPSQEIDELGRPISHSS